MADTKNCEKLSTEIVFREHFAQLGRLTDILYRMLPFFATVIGGLWFFAAQFLNKDKVISAGIFVFAAASSIVFLLAVERMRRVIMAYIDSTERLAGDMAPNVPPPSIIRVAVAFMILLGTAFILSLAGFGYVAYPVICSAN
jgi:hypothetical protein